MMRISLKNNFEKLNYNDLTSFEFEGKIIDLHNLFSTSDIYEIDNSLIIELISNEFYEEVFVGKRKKGEILRLTFLNYNLDTSFDTQFNKELHNNISFFL